MKYRSLIRKRKETEDWFFGPRTPAPPPATLRALISQPSGGLAQEIDERELPEALGRAPHEFALDLLTLGAEFEHSLLVQYLYAAYSINDLIIDTGAARATKLRLLAANWKVSLRQIARQEMGHMLTVENLLRKIGADRPVLDREDFQSPSGRFPLPFVLEKLSLKSLAKYVMTEKPGDELIPTEKRRLMATIKRLAGSAVSAQLPRVGILYAAIYWAFLPTDTPEPEDWPFPGRGLPGAFVRRYGKGFHLSDDDFKVDAERFTATGEEFGSYEPGLHVGKAASRTAALADIRQIMSQGEGLTKLDGEPSHFDRFLSMYEGFAALSKAERRRIIFDVPFNPVGRARNNKRRFRNRPKLTVIQAKNSRLWSELLDARYRLLLLEVMKSLTLHKGDPARGKMADLAVSGEMTFVRSIAEFLAQRHSGATFRHEQLPPPSKAAREEARLRRLSSRIVEMLLAHSRPGLGARDLLNNICSHDRSAALGIHAVGLGAT